MLSDKQFLREHRTMPRSERLKLAYHEAGHAVAARLLGLAVRYVTIMPTKARGDHSNFHLSGHCALERPCAPGLDQATTVVAADVAVRLHLGLTDDLHADVADRVGAVVYEQAKRRARELLDTPEARQEVRLLAAQLLRDGTVLRWEVEEETNGPTNVD